MEDQIEETEMRLHENKMKQEQIMNCNRMFHITSTTDYQRQQKRMDILGKLEGELGKLDGGNIKKNRMGTVNLKTPLV